MLEHDLIRDEFQHLRDIIFLNVASVVIPPQSVQQAYFGFTQEYIANFGESVVTEAWAQVESAREDVATLLGAKSAEIAFVKNTAEGIGIIANGYPFQAGDNIIVPDQEHSSNLFAWIQLQQKGVELRIVPSRNGCIDNVDIFSRFDKHTKAVALSAVQFTTGFYADLYELGEYCRQHRALLIVDGIQAVGRLKVDVQKMNISYLACGGNKGLLATLGAGFVYCNQEIVEKIIPPYASYQSVENHVAPPAITTNFSHLDWHTDARRLESGNLNYAGVAAIGAGARLLNRLGIGHIETYNLHLEGILRTATTDLNLNINKPQKKKHWSGIICIYYPLEKEQEVVAILKRYCIYATMRGGYIRLGIHVYNTEEQMLKVAQALEEIAALGA